MKKKPLIVFISLLIVLTIIFSLVPKKDRIEEISQLTVEEMQSLFIWGDTSPPEAPSLLPTLEEFDFISQAPTTAIVVENEPIDVLVAYTTAAMDQVGGQQQMLEVINSLIADGNQSFRNSNITQRFRLVGTYEVNYSLTETGTTLWINTINALQSGSGSMATVHTLRDQLGADITSLLFYDPTNSYCGLGYVMTDQFLSYGFRDWAVSIASIGKSCIQKWSPIHEMGHNMGDQHDLDSVKDTDRGAFPYSFGHKVEGEFCTVMAYGNKYTCPRVLQWSNPNVVYDGIPTGIANVSDNARSMNNTYSTVISWRQRSISIQDEITLTTQSISLSESKLSGTVMIPYALVEISTNDYTWYQAETDGNQWSYNMVPTKNGSQSFFIRINKGLSYSFSVEVEDMKQVFLPAVFN